MSTPPALVPIINTLNPDHLEFIRQFQTLYNVFRTTPYSEPHGSQKEWVRKNVMGKFQQEFGRASAGALLKIDRYLRNHSTYNQKATTILEIPDLNPRAVSWEEVVEQDNRDTINTRASEIRDDEGVASHGDYLRQFKRARKDFVMALPDARVQEYKEQAEAENQRRKAPPIPAVVFRQQPTIPLVINAAVMKYLGWKAGQLSDVICFVASAYRTMDLEVKTQFSVISNTPFSQDEMIIPDITTKFTEIINPSFRALADKYLPSLRVEQPQLGLNIDNITPRVLREQLAQHIILSWVTSGTQSEHRTEGNVPWKELETLEGQERYLVNQMDFASFGFPCPTSMTSHDLVHEFTMKLTASHASPLFKSPTAGPPSVFNTPLPSTPNSPEPEPSPATSELHNDNHDITQNTDPKEPQSSEQTTPPSPQPAVTPQPTVPQPAVPQPAVTTAPRNRPLFTSPLPDLLLDEDPIPDTPTTPSLNIPATTKTPEDLMLDVSNASGAAGEHSKQNHENTRSNAIDGDTGAMKTTTKRKRQPAKQPPVSARELRSSRIEQPAVMIPAAQRRVPKARRRSGRK